MDLNERYKKAMKEIDEYFESNHYFNKNKITYEETIEEIDDYFNNI